MLEISQIVQDNQSKGFWILWMMTSLLVSDTTIKRKNKSIFTSKKEEKTLIMSCLYTM
nr:MAG TPA: hypothetical protein [Caudoviricetes sp.]